MNTDIKSKPEVTLLVCFALALIILGVRLQVIDMYASATPYWDDWGIGKFLHGYLVSGSSFADLLQASNEHRMFFSRILNIALFNLNEFQWDPLVSMAVNALLWTLSGLFLLLFARANRDTINPYPFIVILMAIWLFPTGLVNIIWGVQSHNYFMILFILLGCWYITYKPFSWRWVLGVVSLFAACLTMAGGILASISIVVVYSCKASIEQRKRKEYLQTAVTVAIIAVLGLLLVYSPNKVGNQFAANDITDFLTSLFKTLSWPLHKSTWPWLIFYAPMSLLVLSSLKAADEKTKRITAFILSLYGFTIIVALAIAYSRGVGGHGPTRRYFDFLSLAIVSGCLAILILQQKQFLGHSRFNKPLILLWLGCLAASVSTQLGVFQFTVTDRGVVSAANERIVREYIITGKESTFENRVYRHVPYPSHKRLAIWLNAFTEADILPMELQVPAMNTEVSGSVFIKNGSVLGTTQQLKVKYREEDVLGSYNMAQGAQHAKGTYQSEEFVTKRSYLMIPSLGYLGHDGLSLKLVEVNTGQTISVKPKARSSRVAEVWGHTFIKVPPGKYKIEAFDQSDKLWFAFAAPRSIGKLSYILRRIISKGKYIWQLGAVLLFLALQNQIVKMFYSPKCQNEPNCM